MALLLPATLVGEAPRSAGPAVDIATPDPDPGVRTRLMLHGGLAGLGGEGLHPFGGLEGGVMWERFGAAAVAQLGSGNGFRSTLLAGGPAVEVAEVRGAAVVAHAGPVRYVERIEAGFTRRLNGVYGALSVRIPLGPGAVGFGATVWRGAVRGEGIVDPASVTGHRFHLGIGL